MSRRKTFEVALLSQSQPVAVVEAVEILVPAWDGERVIRPSHVPLITALHPGILKFYLPSEPPLHYFMGGGCLEFQGSKALILVEIIESSDDIDLERAQAAERRAREGLASSEGSTSDVSRALAALHRAKARQKLAQLARRDEVLR